MARGAAAVASPCVARPRSRRCPRSIPTSSRRGSSRALEGLTPDDVRHWLRHGRGPLSRSGEAIARAWTARLRRGPGRPRASAPPRVGVAAGRAPLRRPLAAAATARAGRAAHRRLCRHRHAGPARADPARAVRPRRDRVPPPLRRARAALLPPRGAAHPGRRGARDRARPGGAHLGRRPAGARRVGPGAGAPGGPPGTPSRLATTGAPGRIVATEAVDPEALGALLEASDLSPHPGEALATVLDLPAEGPRDVVLLTHPRSLRQPEVAASASRAARASRRGRGCSRSPSTATGSSSSRSSATGPPSCSAAAGSRSAPTGGARGPRRSRRRPRDPAALAWRRRADRLPVPVRGPRSDQGRPIRLRRRRRVAPRGGPSPRPAPRLAGRRPGRGDPPEGPGRRQDPDAGPRGPRRRPGLRRVRRDRRAGDRRPLRFHLARLQRRTWSPSRRSWARGRTCATSTRSWHATRSACECGLRWISGWRRGRRRGRDAWTGRVAELSGDLRAGRPPERCDVAGSRCPPPPSLTTRPVHGDGRVRVRGGLRGWSAPPGATGSRRCGGAGSSRSVGPRAILAALDPDRSGKDPRLGLRSTAPRDGFGLRAPDRHVVRADPRRPSRRLPDRGSPAGGPRRRGRPDDPPVDPQGAVPLETGRRARSHFADGRDRQTRALPELGSRASRAESQRPRRPAAPRRRGPEPSESRPAKAGGPGPVEGLRRRGEGSSTAARRSA